MKNEDTKKAVRRFDYVGQINSVEKTPQGFLKVPGFVTRTGVFPYMDANGETRKELRHPDDVFLPESLATLKNAVVTLDHPPVMITPENYKQYSMGYSTDGVQPNDNMVECTLIIAGDPAISAVEDDGLRELSAGYECDLEPESGIFEGAPYTHRQKNITYNHIAIVKQGRAGPEARLRMDSADAEMQSEGPDVVEIDVGGQKVSVPKHAAEIITAMMDRYDQMRGQLVTLEGSMGKARTDMDVNQKGVSPQVDVVQQAPDGRGAGAKADGTTENPMGTRDPNPNGKQDVQAVPNAGKQDDDGGTLGDAIGYPKVDAGTDLASGPKNDLQSKMDQMKSMMDTMQAQLDEMNASGVNPASMNMDDDGDDKDKDSKNPFAKKDADAAMKAPKMDSASYQQAVRTRVKLEKTGEKLLPRSVSERFDSMSDEEIRMAVIKQKHPKFDAAGKSKTYIQTRFDMICDEHDEGEETRRSMGSFLMNQGHMDAADVSPEAARKKMSAASKQEWMQPLSAVKK